MVDTQTERRAVEQNGLYQTDDHSEEPQDQAIRDRSPHEGSSDSDNAERTARNKLKKASIAALSEHSQPISVAHGTHPPRESVTAGSLQAEVQPSNRGRLPKKRSFENLQTDDSLATTENGSADQPHPKTGHHKRMRSRDISSGVYIPSGTKFENGAGDPLEEESDDEAQESPGGPGVLVDATSLDAATPQPLQISDPVDAAKPEKKRSRDQLDADETSKLAGLEDSEQFKASLEDDELAPTISRNAIGEPEKKRHAAGKTDTDAISSSPSTSTAIPATSAFANTSTASPFGNFKSSPKDPQNAEAQSTSTSAFASSGLSAFASSEKSPFGVFGSSGSTSSGGFGSGTAPTGFSSAPATTTKGGFGNRGATSPFAANSTTGFGSLGGGFGSSITGGFGGGRFGGGIKPLGGGLSSFASASGPGGFGGGAGAKQKAFGAPDEEDEDGSDGGDSNDDDADERPRDRRFVEQDHETGEEDERTNFSCRAKLYQFEDKQWKERGTGTVKLNTKRVLQENSEDAEEDEEAGLSRLEKQTARLIMRTDGVHRVVLNTPIFEGMKVGTTEGGEPSGRAMSLTGMEGGKPVLYMLKTGKEEAVKELWRRITDVQQRL